MTGTHESLEDPAAGGGVAARLLVVVLSAGEAVPGPSFVLGDEGAGNHVRILLSAAGGDPAVALREAARVHGTEWIFICSPQTVLHLPRLMELLEEVEDVVCNARRFSEAGLLCTRAGFAVRGGMLAGLGFTKNGEDIYGIFDAGAAGAGGRLLGTPELRFNESRLIRPGNSLVTQTVPDDRWFGMVRALCSEKVVERLTILDDEWGDGISLLESGVFVRDRSSCFGRLENAGGAARLVWENRPDTLLSAAEEDGRAWEGPVVLREQGAPGAGAVPKILHFIWFGGALPVWASRNIATWRNHHPAWQVRIWGDADEEEFLTFFSDVERARFKEIRSNVIKADLVRMGILRALGGVYVDTDFVCYSPLLDWIPADIAFGYGEKPGGLPECALMISGKGHPFLTWFLWKAFRFWDDLTPGQRRNPTKDEVVWPMNNIDRRVRAYFGPHDPSVVLRNGGRIWATCDGDVIAIADHFLHGAEDAGACHDYLHSWW